MSRKRRKETRRKSSGLLAAAILFVFVFEHFFVPFSYATSPDMASASDAVRSGKVALINAPEEDVQIAVISGDVDSTSGYSAGQQVCLDVYIKNNTADTITDGFLKYAGRGIEKDRESTYFELIEGAVRDPVPGEDEDAGEDLPGETEERDLDTGDQDLDTGDRDPDTEERDLDKPDVLEDLVLSPGQSCHVGFYYTIKEDLRGTKDQSIEFTFGWDEDGGNRTCKQTFRYVVGAMNLLPVEIVGSGQTAWGAAQIHAGEAGEMFLDFDLGEVWDVIDERLEEESSREDEDIPADTTVDGDGAADTDEETGKAEDAGEADRGDKEGDIVKDESGENADTAGGAQGDEGRQDVSHGGGTQGETADKTAGAETGAPSGDDAGEAGQSKDADRSEDADQSVGAGQNDGAVEQEPVLQMGEPRDIPLVREPLETELDVLAADEKADAPEGTDDTGTKEPADPAGEQPAVPPVAEGGQVVLPPDAGEEQVAEPSTGESEPVPVPPAADDGQTAEPPTGESEPVPVPPAADGGQTAEPPIAESEPVPVPPAVEGGQIVVPPAMEGGQVVVPPAAEDGQIVAAPTATPSTSVPRPDDGLNGLIKWEDDAVAGSEKPVIKGIRCDVETYGIKLDAFKVAEEEEGEEDGQSTSVCCTFRVNGEVKPGTYYGTVKAVYAFKGRTFHSTQGFIIVVPEIEDEEVAEVIRLIDALPEQDEVEEAFAAYDLAEDEDGRDAYYMELYTQVMEAYRKYMALSSEQQEKVYNRDKLMAYEWLWGGAMLAVGEVTTWTQLEDAIAAGQTIITLANNINGTGNKQIDIGAGKDITLDLNGYTLTYTGNGNAIFSVAGSFTIAGSTEDDKGGIILGKEVGNVIDVAANGTLWIKGGKITTENSERAIFSRGIVNIEGGAISGNRNSGPSDKAGGIWAHGGELNISGGSIDHNSAQNGGGIYTTLGATVNISGGTIAYNTATGDGGGICDCHSTDDAAGRPGSTINISGGSIEHNTAKNGGGIYVNSNASTAKVNVAITSGTIKNNIASENGGGIYVKDNMAVTVEGGDITNNAADENGGGIYVTAGPFTVKGGDIASNKAQIGGGITINQWCDFHLLGGNIKSNHAQSAGGGIAITGSNALKLNGGTIQGNTSDGDGGGIAIIGDRLGKRKTHALYLYDESIESGDGNGTDIIGNTAAGNGGGISVTGNDNEIIINKGNISGNKAGNVEHKIEHATDDPKLAVDSEGKKKDDIHGNGGGIYIEPKSDLDKRSLLTINGGLISNNESYAVTLDTETPNSVGGGGIFTGGDLTITGGEITDNYAAEGGGGILFYYRFTSGGDGVMPSSGVTRPRLKMTGGTISGNVAVKSEGGGLYFQGEGEISGGQFTGNETRTIYDYGGGGIFIMTNATLKLYNALITDNNAEGYGGGLAGCAKSNTYAFSIKGGAIYHNRANGDQTHLTLSKAGDEKVLKVDDFGQRSNGSKDYFCSGKSVVYDHMLGGGHSRWSGFCDGDTMAVPLNGFVKTKENSDYADNRTGKGLMGLTADPTSDDIAKVERVQDKVIIKGNRSNTHGGGVSSNGVLYLGEGTGTDWEPSAEKIYYVDGKLTDPTKGQFTFVMLDKEPERDPQTGKLRYEEQSVVSTATNNEKGEIRFSIMADRAFSPEDFTDGSEGGDPKDGATHTYTFYVMEKDDDIHTIRYDTTVYKIDITMKMHVREEQDIQDNIVSTVKIYHYTVEKDADGKAHMTVTVMRPDGSGSVEGDKIEFTNFWVSPPPGDGGGNGGGGGDEPPTPTQPVPPPENPPIIPSDDRGNGSVVEIVEEEINVPIFALPDAELPEMPEQITLFENGVPRGYRRVWNPDTQQWEWIPEDEIPLTGLAKTGDDSHPMLWIALFLGSIVGIVTLVVLRRKSVQEMKAEDRKQSGSGS